MATFTGTVDCISVNESSGFTSLRDAAGTVEPFILWFGTTIPPSRTALTQVIHSMWLSLLREAQSSGRTITISHPTNSAEVTNVRANA